MFISFKNVRQVIPMITHNYHADTWSIFMANEITRASYKNEYKSIRMILT